MCQDLRPGYTPPNREMLGGELLDEIYDEVKEKTAEFMVQVKTLCITQDGWSSVQNDPVIAHTFCDGQKLIF
ncbi:Uncharacterized protein FKW44_008540 [Caligus rogercresseyi]|uniref:DUF659 domain-containing protein n=1 Tax=Caligus rogercresseyi TaxID=217165 RepID=A0A7T8QUC4_CALRO|nr:Uncharacterized protein FKW44_008540 [Caligus rogercresseyi]